MPAVSDRRADSAAGTLNNGRTPKKVVVIWLALQSASTGGGRTVQ